MGPGASAAGPAPGRVTTRRLNATEYDNTVRDLLGVDLQLSARSSSFPTSSATASTTTATS